MTGPDQSAERVGLGEIFGVFLWIGTISFGGGAVGYLRQSLVLDKGWLDEARFLSGLELSQTLPGLNATNMGVYVGSRLRGAPGAILAVLGLILPGLILVLALGASYAVLQHNEAVLASLHGVAAAATGFLFAVAVQTGREQLTNIKPLVLVILTFLAMSILRLPLAVVLLVLGGMSIWLHRPRKARSGDDGDGGTKT
jgi:chromate transporter